MVGDALAEGGAPGGAAREEEELLLVGRAAAAGVEGAWGLLPAVDLRFLPPGLAPDARPLVVAAEDADPAPLVAPLSRRDGRCLASPLRSELAELGVL